MLNKWKRRIKVERDVLQIKRQRCIYSKKGIYNHKKVSDIKEKWRKKMEHIKMIESKSVNKKEFTHDSLYGEDGVELGR